MEINFLRLFVVAQQLLFVLFAMSRSFSMGKGHPMMGDWNSRWAFGNVIWNRIPGQSYEP